MPFLKGKDTKKGTGGLGFLALSHRFGGSFSKPFSAILFTFTLVGAKCPQILLCARFHWLSRLHYRIFFFLGSDFERLLRR